jgi:HSP20 family protein
MTSIVKSNSGSLPKTFTGLVDNFFQEGISTILNDNFWNVGGLSLSQQVPVNIKETNTAYELQVVAPGLKKQDFKLNLADDMLTISFEQKPEDYEEGTKWVRNEYRLRSFERNFHLDETVDDSNISAKYLDGVLTITIPKKREVQKIVQNITVQ